MVIPVIGYIDTCIIFHVSLLLSDLFSDPKKGARAPKKKKGWVQAFLMWWNVEKAVSCWEEVLSHYSCSVQSAYVAIHYNCRGKKYIGLNLAKSRDERFWYIPAYSIKPGYCERRCATCESGLQSTRLCLSTYFSISSGKVRKRMIFYFWIGIACRKLILTIS